MATKEDILEQIVEDYLLHLGFFVRHNLKFRPEAKHPDFVSNQHSNHSDIDIIGMHPLRQGVDRVWVISCKSWQQGFNPQSQIEAVRNNTIRGGREAWKNARELWKPIWSDAFIREIKNATGQDNFTYITAVTRIIGQKELWENCEEFKKNLCGNPVKLIDLRQMVEEICLNLNTTVAGTEVGRMLQLFKAAGIMNMEVS
jgi:hypothetical protein